MMVLALDLGNTLHKCALFSADEIIHLQFSSKVSTGEIANILLNYKPAYSIISSVDKYDEELQNYIFSYTKGFVLDHRTPLPVKNLYTTPETLGNDRLANAVGAQSFYPGKNVIIIDAGTCIKYDFINAESEYLGGAISPGLSMRLRAMHDYTARLPLIDINNLTNTPTIDLVGNSTTASLLSGAGKGALLEVEGAIDAYNKLYDDLVVALTGGDAPFFELHLKRKIFTHPNLVLFGLNKILQHNVNLPGNLSWQNP